MAVQQNHTVWTGYLSAGSVTAGDVVCLNAAGTRYVKATTANITAQTLGSVGVAITSADTTNVSFELQFCGLIPESITGLGAGTATTIQVSTTGTLERGASGEVVGKCDTAGNALVNFATAAELAGVGGTPGGSNKQFQYNSSGTAFGGVSELTYEGSGRLNLTTSGYVTYGPVADDYPTSGLIRIGQDQGAGGVESDILTWKKPTGGVNVDLLAVIDTGSSSWYRIGDTAITTTYLEGAAVEINGSNGITLNGGTGTTAGTFLNGNWSLGYVSGLDFKSGEEVGFIANSAAQPSAAPDDVGCYLYVTNLQTYWWYVTNERFRFGGCTDSALNSTTRKRIKSLSSDVTANTGPARWEFISRNSWSRDGRYWNEELVAAASTQTMAEYDMADETIVAFEWTVVVCQATTATKAAVYRGSAQYKRTAAGAPALLGTAAYDVHETTAADGFSINISGNIVQFQHTSADADQRRVCVRIDAFEVRAA
jgi:hypothetical protein